MVSGSRKDISSHVDEWRSQYRENTNEMQTTTTSSSIEYRIEATSCSKFFYRCNALHRKRRFKLINSGILSINF